MFLNLKKFLKNWSINLFSHFSIAKKIGYGYSLSVSIAVTGTAIGFLSADYYHIQAQQKLILVENQQNLLYSLENAVLNIYNYPQRILLVLENSIWYQYQTNKFLVDLNQVQSLLSQLNTFVEENPEQVAVNSHKVLDFLEDYQQAVDSYTDLIRFLWNKIDSFNLKSEEISQVEQTILTGIQGDQATEIMLEFERLSEELIRIKQELDKQQQQANAELKQADTLRVQIIMISMALSVSIASLLAIHTSHAIARPIKEVTNIAHKVTNEANFDLQAHVTTTDEIGSLAISLNQLIDWVRQYTQELEQARETLEVRVDERTQELYNALENLKQTQTQLIQSEKMSSLGQMVAGIAHEINNPVNFIHANLIPITEYTQDLLTLIHLYQEQYPQSHPKIEEYLEEIDFDFLPEDLSNIISSMNIGTSRIKDIVLSLRNFSRLDEAEVKEVNLHEGIDNTLLILNYRLKLGVEVVKHYGDLPLVSCYPAQLNQVFMNILANAVDALFENNIEPKKIIIHTAKINANQVQVSIKDNGSGIKSEIIPHLFDPFFTTKPIGQGTGLGLSIAYQIVNQHQGEIEVKSEVGQGTEFLVTLPVFD